VSDPIGHDREPDRAALDELRRAFGEPELEDVTATSEVPFEFEIVEQDPIPPATTVAPEIAPHPAGHPAGHPDGHLDGKLAPKHDPAEDATAPVTDPVPAPVTAPVTAPVPVPVPVPEPQPAITIDDFGGDASDQQTGQHPMPEPTPPVPSSPAAGERRVIAIEADDLPDAVYVEGDLSAGGSGSMVFIEDDPQSDALTPESDRDLRRGIEPRMRERRVAVKRAQHRKRLKWVVGCVFVFLLVVGALALFGSSMFAVRADQVTVSGIVYTDRQRLQAVIDDLVGTPVLLVDTGRTERELEAIAWVERAKVTIDFPHAARIDISERAAVATYQGPDQRFRVLDRDGRVLDVLDKYPFAYVLISGQDAADLEPGQFAPQGYQAAAELAKNLTGTVRGRVEQIEVTAAGDRLTMLLDDGSEVRFGEARDLFNKMVRLETILLADPDREPGPIDVATAQTTS
jgi:cell division septal protein FtsQ